MGPRVNINRRGRIARFVSGLFLLGAAAVAYLSQVEIPGPWFRGIFLGALVFLGLFQIFEALAGWCIARALGFKTPV